MQWKIFLFGLNSCFQLNIVLSAKILGIFPFPSHSHQIVYQRIWKELSLKGHLVTVVTPSPLNDPKLINLTEINVDYIANSISKNEQIEKTFTKESSAFTIIKKATELSHKLYELILQNEKFQKIYKRRENFDLIMVEMFHPGPFIFGGVFDAPIIGVSSMGAPMNLHYMIGNPNHPIFYPDVCYQYHMGRLNWWQKIYSLSTYLSYVLYFEFKTIPTADKISRKYLGNGIPYLGDVIKSKTSAFFLNTNPVIYKPRPNIPTVIELGFMHIRDPKALPEDLKIVLDSAKQGFVYFSLGSNVKSANLDKNLQKNILLALSELPYLVLWKWETDNLPDKPKNVITRKWVPQQDVLAHPNIKVFVSQCGYQSIEEAITREVPIVGLPFIGDQPMNIQRLELAGVAVQVDPLTLTKDQLKGAIMEVATNQKYKTKMGEIKKLLLDQPLTGLEKAVWWSEYVIRHKGTEHLRTALVDSTWIEYLMIDVFLIIFSFLLVTIFIIYILIKLFFSLFKKKDVKKIKTK